MHYITTNQPTPRADRTRYQADFTWQPRARCHGMDLRESDRIFFPSPSDTEAIAKALRICHACPVLDDCFDTALDMGSSHGIRAGLTEEDRAWFHQQTELRLDYTRVMEAIEGRDVALSTTERDAVVRHALLHGWNNQEIAHLLQITRHYARKLMREQRGKIDKRDREWHAQACQATTEVTETAARATPASATPDTFGTAA